MCFYAEAFKLAHHHRNCGTRAVLCRQLYFIIFAELRHY